jgi:hypothetical protein
MALSLSISCSAVFGGDKLIAPSGGFGTIIDGRTADCNFFAPTDGLGDCLLSIGSAAVADAYEDIHGNRTIWRGVMEFSLEGLTGPVESAVLQTLQETNVEGLTVEIYGYAGDGVLSVEDYSAGTLFLEDQYQFGPYEVDITELVNSLIGNATHVGLVFRLPEPESVSPRPRLRMAHGWSFLRFSDDLLGHTVEIDVKPGSYPNCFNLNGKGVIPVAIFGSETFDVTTINVEEWGNALSLNFGGLFVQQRRSHFMCSVEDVNNDSFWDMVCKFEEWLGNWDGDVDEVTLRGTTYDGGVFEGTDSICLVPNKRNN